MIALNPVHEEHDEVSFAVAGNQKVVRVTTITVRELVDDGLLWEMSEVRRGDNVYQDSVASFVLSSEEVFEERDEGAKVGQSSTHGSIDAHWKAVHAGTSIMPHSKAPRAPNWVSTM